MAEKSGNKVNQQWICGNTRWLYLNPYSIFGYYIFLDDEVHWINRCMKGYEFPSETLTGLLSLAQVGFLLPPLPYYWFINVEFSHSCSNPMICCVTDTLEFEISFISVSLRRCHFGVLIQSRYVEARYVLVHEAPDYGCRNAPATNRALQFTSLAKSYQNILTEIHLKSALGQLARPESRHKAHLDYKVHCGFLRKLNDFKCA